MADQLEAKQILSQADAAGVFNAKEREQLGGVGKKLKVVGRRAGKI